MVLWVVVMDVASYHHHYFSRLCVWCIFNISLSRNSEVVGERGPLFYNPFHSGEFLKCGFVVVKMGSHDYFEEYENLLLLW